MIFSCVICFVCWSLFINGISTQETPIECSENLILDDLTRSIQYELRPSDPNKCDRFITEGWYRVVQNGTIARDCPEILRCGSISPIWINGSLPAVGEVRSLKACYRGFVTCCSISFNINVRNCGGFLVYQLIAPPACPGRYCIDGPDAPCGEGMSSESGFEPCEKISIDFKVEVSVEPFIPTFQFGSKNNSLAFRCQELKIMNTQYQSYLFDYAWYVDGEEVKVKEKIKYASLKEGRVLYIYEWANKTRRLGFQIYCAVRARENNKSVPTPYIKSKEFYAGMKITQPSTFVNTNTTVILKITSTVPVPCKEVNGKLYDCQVPIEMYSLKDETKIEPAQCNSSTDVIDTSSSCGMNFDGKKWTIDQDFQLETQQDSSSRSSYTCAVQLVAKWALDHLWENYRLPEIKILVNSETERPRGKCYSVNDPHVRTVDGKYFTFNEKGEFVLYRHQQKPIDIHTIQKWWGNKEFAVNCAIIIRAQDDMFVIYGCQDPPRWFVRRLNCESGNQFLDVIERSQQYEIVLPTGTKIVVNIIGNRWLNIYIYYSPGDWNQTEGLCGTYNGNPHDDRKSLSDLIVPESKSLFRVKSRKEKMKIEVQYCSCFNETQLESKETKADCKWQESLPVCKPTNWKEIKCQNYGRNKREIDDDLEFDVSDDIISFKKSKTVFEWRNGWTEGKAVNACKSYAENSKLYQACNKLSNVQSDSDLNTCVADIKISTSDFYLTGSLDRMKSACVHEIRTNTSFWKPKPIPPTTAPPASQDTNNFSTTTTSVSSSTSITSTTDTPNDDSFFDFDTSSFLAEIVEEIINEDCPNSCSDAGVCEQGVCKCNKGYKGDDCSVDINKDLELLGISKESFCDTSKRACSEVSVFAAEFYESDTIACLIKEAKLERNELKPQDVNITSSGSLRSFSEVRCPISDLTSLLNTAPNRSLTVFDIFLISVSLDGLRFSTESPIVMYDSTCTNCRLEGINVKCETREDICIVDQKCYDNQHEICIEKRKTSVEPIPSTTAPASSQESNDVSTATTSASSTTSVENKDCPNSCSDAGVCEQGVCKCNKGYKGDDCSVDINEDLELLGISKESFCDTSKRACSEVSVFAAEFYESDTIECLIKEAKLEGNEFKPQGKRMTEPGSLQSFTEVRCPISDLTSLLNTASNRSLPVVDIFLISVSLDGLRFSTESPIVVYDSTCTNCRLKGTNVKCETRDEICIVEQKCLNKQHELCKQKKKKEMEENVNYAFVGYSLGGLGLIMIPALFMYKRYKSSRRTFYLR